MNARGKLPVGSGPSPARPDRYKKGSFLRLQPEKWAELAPTLSPELRATYWSLLALAPGGEFAERSAGKLANLLNVRPTQARELVDELAAVQFSGGPLCFVEDRKGSLVVRLAINNGLLVLISPGASATTAPVTPTTTVRTAPPRDFPTLIASARLAFCDLAGEGGCELADALLAALAEREADGQLPGGRQVAFYRELAELHAIGGSHVAAGLHEMLRRRDLPADQPMSYLRAIVMRRVAESGRANGSSKPAPTDLPVATPHLEVSGADVSEEPAAEELEVRRTADGRRISSDFNPDDMF